MHFCVKSLALFASKCLVSEPTVLKPLRDSASTNLIPAVLLPCKSSNPMYILLVVYLIKHIGKKIYHVLKLHITRRKWIIIKETIAFSFYTQDFLTNSLAELLNYHFFLDPTSVLGQVIMELGRTETFLTRSAWNMAEGQLTNIPNPVGSFLCQFIRTPDEVDLEHVTSDVMQVK